MKTEVRDGSRVRKVLRWFAFHADVLGKFTTHWKKDGLFGSREQNLIGKWCIKHYNEYSQAPGRALETYFETYSEKSQDKATVELVNKLLIAILEEGPDEVHKLGHMVDVSQRHFHGVELERLENRIRQLREQDNIEEALNEVSSFDRLELGRKNKIHVTLDIEEMRLALERSVEPIFTYAGDMGDFINPNLLKGEFLTFFGAEKRGKSFWLMEMAWSAMEQRQRVLFFEVGDMSEGDVLRRFATRAARRPLYAKTIKYPKSFKTEKGKTRVKHEEKIFKDKLSTSEVEAAMERVHRRKIHSKNSYLNLICVPNNTYSVANIQADIIKCQNEGWPPDVVIIDYADILAPLDRRKEGRDQINETWMALRALSQRINSLVITATQVKAAAYQAEILGKEHFSEDKRKLAHATGIIGINQNEHDREDDKYRLNWIENRHRNWPTGKVVHVAGCRDICNLCLHSTF